MIVTLTDATFDALVLQADRPVLVDFTADWCPPCRMIKPMLREIAAEQADRLIVAELDVDTNPTATRAAGVMGMPTLTLYVDGRPVTQVVGARPKAALMRVLDEHLPVRVGPPAQ
ncbi:MAG TPA: thioredoxin domain-containing protein [Pseudonocardia sp.]